MTHVRSGNGADVEVVLRKSRVRWCDAVQFAVFKTSSGVRELLDGHYRLRFVLDGAEITFREGVERRFALHLPEMSAQIGTVWDTSFQVIVEPTGGPERIPIGVSAPVPLQIDLRDVEQLPAPSGDMSCYARYRGAMYALTPYGRSTTRMIWKVTADPSTAHTLSRYYLVAANGVWDRGRQLKDANPATFQVFNVLFAGDERNIYTTYGNARIAHPASFQVLDRGDQHWSGRSGDKFAAGWARDEDFGYWFDTTISSTHATRVRGCVAPETLIPLGCGYARDRDHVYHQGRRLPRADPETWEPLNRNWSRDAQRVYYLNRLVPRADRDTLRLITNPHEAPGDRELATTRLAADRHHTYETDTIIENPSPA